MSDVFSLAAGMVCRDKCTDKQGFESNFCITHRLFSKQAFVFVLRRRSTTMNTENLRLQYEDPEMNFDCFNVFPCTSVFLAVTCKNVFCQNSLLLS
ncbi:hypothetical protein EXN66_Car016075 [Channa argus]|uniref:Uncharacterized protein n=1 Tax=Channa argus TaxID=215402 RepID=A0A6G1QDR4_CHAAH|nr:hypothetical protein EXN66_Car016075 [Channa argus]